jgi:hypothetical protein
MMVGSALFDPSIVAAGIACNISIMMLAKVSNRIIGKYGSSMKLLLQTPHVAPTFRQRSIALSIVYRGTSVPDRHAVEHITVTTTTQE